MERSRMVTVVVRGDVGRVVAVVVVVVVVAVAVVGAAGGVGVGQAVDCGPPRQRRLLLGETWVFRLGR